MRRRGNSATAAACGVSLGHSRSFALLELFASSPTNDDASVHVAITDHPTAAWTAQQLRNAFPDDERPSSLIHDRDTAFAAVAGTIVAISDVSVSIT